MPSTIKELYRVFQPYRLEDDFTKGSACVSATDSQRLASIPLRELSVIDVDRYAFKAMTTWGTVRQFKHFLPRLMELAMADYLAFNYPEVLLGKLAYADWNSWPEDERNAVREFLDAFWLHQLNTPGEFPRDERIQTVVGGLAAACDSIEPYLAIWCQQKAVVPAMHLAQLLSDSADDIMTAGTIELWGNPASQCAELVNWIASDNAASLLDMYRDTIAEVFPHVRNQLDGIRAALSAE